MPSLGICFTQTAGLQPISPRRGFGLLTKNLSSAINLHPTTRRRSKRCFLKSCRRSWYLFVRESIFWCFEASKINFRPRSSFWRWSFGSFVILSMLLVGNHRDLCKLCQIWTPDQPHAYQKIDIGLKFPALSLIPENIGSQTQTNRFFSNQCPKQKIF